METIYLASKHRQSYDDFICRYTNGSFRQSYAWGEVMAYENEINRIGVIDNEQLVASISLQKRKLPGLPWSFYYAPRGLNGNISSSGSIKALLNEVICQASRDRAIFLRIDPDVLDEDIDFRNSLIEYGFNHLSKKNWSYFNYPRVLMRVDLTLPEDILLGNMRKKHRQHIKTAANKGIVLEKVESIENIFEFYNLMNDLSIRKGFPVRSVDYYIKLYNNFGNDLKVLLARHDGKLVAGVMSLIFGGKSWYMHGATIEEKGNLHPVELLHWEIMKWAKGKGCSFYDLGGTGTDYPPQIENKNYNLYHFKQGFGANLTYLTGYYDLVFNPLLYRIFRIAEEHFLPKGVEFFATMKKNLSHHE